MVSSKWDDHSVLWLCKITFFLPQAVQYCPSLLDSEDMECTAPCKHLNHFIFYRLFHRPSFQCTDCKLVESSWRKNSIMSVGVFGVGLLCCSLPLSGYLGCVLLLSDKFGTDHWLYVSRVCIWTHPFQSWDNSRLSMKKQMWNKCPKNDVLWSYSSLAQTSLHHSSETLDYCMLQVVNLLRLNFIDELTWSRS